mmetsp:Transcript_8536/g.24407  ORF Transcript_8536/g.24407 Transcript_8536/m.24407 type:complete len:282 (-) Transcript_8536:1180-2025(-)
MQVLLRGGHAGGSPRDAVRLQGHHRDGSQELPEALGAGEGLHGVRNMRGQVRAAGGRDDTHVGGGAGVQARPHHAKGSGGTRRRGRGGCHEPAEQELAKFPLAARAPLQVDQRLHPVGVLGHHGPRHRVSDLELEQLLQGEGQHGHGERGPAFRFRHRGLHGFLLRQSQDDVPCAEGILEKLLVAAGQIVSRTGGRGQALPEVFHVLCSPDLRGGGRHMQPDAAACSPGWRLRRRGRLCPRLSAGDPSRSGREENVPGHAHQRRLRLQAVVKQNNIISNSI